MIRLILYIILIYLAYHFVKKLIAAFSTPQKEVKRNSKNQVRDFDKEDIEDVDYKEVKRNKTKKTS